MELKIQFKELQNGPSMCVIPNLYDVKFHNGSVGILVTMEE